jgi:hypothetical protein
MASKRVINRTYWAAVKATAAVPGDFHSLAARRLYRYAKHNQWTDREVLPLLERYEARYGPARLKDVSNSDLWAARREVESFAATPMP